MKKLFFLIIVVFLFSNLFSTEILSWYDVLKEAKEKNYQLKQTELNLQQTRLKLEKLKGDFYPQISLGAASSKNYKENFESETNYSYSLSLGINLFSGFSRINNLKLQILELQIMEEFYIRTLSDIISELKKNFVNLWCSQEMITLAEKIFQRRQQNYELVKLKYESGREDLGSFLRVEADKFQAEYDLIKAKRDYEQSLRELLKTIGKESFEEIKIKTDFSFKNDTDNFLTKDVAELISLLPEYKIKKYQVEQIKLQEKITKSNFYPTISASIGYGLSDTKPIPDTNKWNLSFTLRASYNIFNGFKDLNDLKIANINIKTKELELYDTKLNLQNNFYLLKKNFIDLKELLKVKEKYLKALEKQAEIISIKYANGLATYYDWYQTEDSFINLQKNLLNLKKELIISEIELKKFLGFTE